MTYVYSPKQVDVFTKFGVRITPYEQFSSSISAVFEEVELGHLQEWYSDKSTYHWFIIEGSGVFVINNEKYNVNQNDIVVVPPKNRIHYFGNMKMFLFLNPPYDDKSEHEVRLISIEEAML